MTRDFHPLRLPYPLIAIALAMTLTVGTDICAQDEPETPDSAVEMAPESVMLPDEVEPEEGLPEEVVQPPDSEAPTPEVVEVPVEAVAPTAPIFRYESPFSLHDCIGILRSVLAGLPVSDRAVRPAFDVASLRRALEVVANYMKARDDLHFNLVDYRWERVGVDSVTSALIQPIRFAWADPSQPQNVDAFSLEVLRGDVFLHSMMVYDQDDNLVADYKFDGLRVMRLRHSLPRREFFHLWRPTAVSRVELAVSRYDPAAPEYPQIQLHAGRTDRPEFGKASIYFLTRAEQELAANQLEDAREDLQQALSNMISYNQTLRQRR